MPKVTTQKASRDYPDYGIKKGDMYYAWSFFRQPRQISKTAPKPSQLTQREELRLMLEAQEAAAELKWEEGEREFLIDQVSAIVDLLNEARDAAQDKYDNMPENFQQGEHGQFLETFVSECDDAIGELEEIGSDLDPDGADDFDNIAVPSDISWPSEG